MDKMTGGGKQQKFKTKGERTTLTSVGFETGTQRRLFPGWYRQQNLVFQRWSMAVPKKKKRKERKKKENRFRLSLLFTWKGGVLAMHSVPYKDRQSRLSLVPIRTAFTVESRMSHQVCRAHRKDANQVMKIRGSTSVQQRCTINGVRSSSNIAQSRTTGDPFSANLFQSFFAIIVRSQKKSFQGDSLNVHTVQWSVWSKSFYRDTCDELWHCASDSGGLETSRRENNGLFFLLFFS